MEEKVKKNIKFNILAIVLIILFSVSISPITLQNDTYYTIKIGEHILETGGIDLVDPFSWHENLTYMYPHWLYDIFIYLIYSLGGMTGIYVSTCALASILGISIYPIMPVPLTFNVLLYSAISSSERFHLLAFERNLSL